jgi:transcriptional regulator of NAD metabolism
MNIDMLLIVKALREAICLISEEYGSVVDEELKHQYEEVMEVIEKALDEIRQKA